MNTCSYTILGGDFDRVGLAAGSLKHRLKKLGVPPDALRRAVIAAYEAEANIVVHAGKGMLRAVLEPSRIDVEVTDEGPGIPDIDLAMKEGFSTASPAARALGFGAGMGLPNMKRNSGSFSIESDLQRGTRIRFSIDLPRQEIVGTLRNSVRIAGELCRGCMRCLNACPTRAMRIRPGGPEILTHLCIDCAACIDACDARAVGIADNIDVPTQSEHALLVVPASFLVDFGPVVEPHQVLDALSTMGFRGIRMIEEWEAATRQAVLAYAREEAEIRPVLSPVCPAVVNLIQMRFPSLLPHVAPFLSAVEAVREDLAGERVFLGVSCPAQHTLVNTGRSSSTPVPLMLSRLRGAVFSAAIRHRDTATGPPRQPGPEERAGPDVLQASGLRHVLNILDKAENGLLADFVLLELLACEQGCFGSPAGGEEPFIARHRWQRVRRDLVRPAKAFRRKTPLVARAGMRLDDDMSRAVEKLLEIDRLTADLPGKNCGMCGAPACSDLAEDLVLGRAQGMVCPHRADGQEKSR